jgi:hypothetical protein
MLGKSTIFEAVEATVGRQIVAMTESKSLIIPRFQLTLETKLPIAEVLARIAQVTDDEAGKSLGQRLRYNGPYRDFSGQIVNRTFDLQFPNPGATHRLLGQIKEVGLKTEISFDMRPLLFAHLSYIIRGLFLLFLIGVVAYLQVEMLHTFPWGACLLFLGGGVAYILVLDSFHKEAEKMRDYFMQMLEAS